MTRADWIAIIISLTMLPVVYIYNWRTQTRAVEATITDPQHHTRTIMLDHDQIIHVHGKLGDSVLEVREGKIRFIKSPCTTKFCIHSGWLKYNGDVMACLPNGVFVEVSGGTRKYDAINF